MSTNEAAERLRVALIAWVKTAAFQRGPLTSIDDDLYEAANDWLMSAESAR